ncbi:pyrroline-5-carboxylate reductase [Peptostreptococcus russellii]|uniref:Pyrroline-5-carboxylate reductase n=1 Tax=Peptostreptococcus russellii TaxID=215200 RepID=A0A1H8FRN4_9FIRM|nr:pyrroline-5-carboxylate reductase [Peptostreptococcus russellii]SEN34393.1 pyrroline-5-carboxylate reductase [Peptostreptococcus russellii]
MKSLAVIGAGNMGRAIIGGVINSGLLKAENVIVSDPYEPSLARVKEEYGTKTTTDSCEAVKAADAVLFAVKPNIIGKVFAGIRDSVDDNTIIISIAAATSVEFMEASLGADKKIVRVMPNTPALVGEGMAALSPNRNVTEEELNDVLGIFNSFGKAEVVPESLMDAVVGVSGSSPAYVFMFIEAMADAAVLTGMPRAQAYKFAAQSVYGAAKMVLETGKHPGELKDMVCSPGGTTIVAVETLEACGLRNAVIQGQVACVEKSIDMANK